jgi:predicted DNA-binding protein with PD1-like motif
MDDFEHAHPAMAGNEGLKLFCRLVDSSVDTRSEISISTAARLSISL